MKKHIIILREHTFWLNCSVFINCTIKEMEDALAKVIWQNISTWVDESDLWIFVNVVNQASGKNLPIIYLREYDGSLESDWTAIHEISHFIFSMLNYRWINIIWKSDSMQEIFCYMLDYFYKQFKTEFNKKYERDNRNRSVTKGVNNVVNELKDKDDKADTSDKWKSVKKNKVKIRPKGVEKNSWRNKVKNK